MYELPKMLREDGDEIAPEVARRNSKARRFFLGAHILFPLGFFLVYWIIS